jgi:hypothetical protein
MHTRRFGAFLIGMWLMGSILVWYTSSLSELTAARVFSDPPQQLGREPGSTGPEITRQLVQYHSAELNRRLGQTWEILQLGLLGALLAISILNAHRSHVVISSVFVMTVIVFVQIVAVTPGLTAASRALDFVPDQVSVPQRLTFAAYDRWQNRLDAVKMVLALVIISRLTFDFYDFSAGSRTNSQSARKHRRTPGSSASGAVPFAESE